MGDSSGASALGWILGPTFGLIGTLMLCAMLGKAGVGALYVTLAAILSIVFVLGLTTILTRSVRRKSQRAFGQLFANIIASASIPTPDASRLTSDASNLTPNASP